MGTRLSPQAIGTSWNHLAGTEIMINKSRFDWDCLIILTSHPLTQFFLYLSLQLMSVPQRWVEMFTCPLPVACHINESFFALHHSLAYQDKWLA
jgi:hypothetical protein